MVPLNHAVGRTGRLRWAAAWVARAGEAVCGDRWTVQAQGAAVLVAVADGLGHGPAAREAAEAALAPLASPGEDDLGALVLRAHAAAARGRGVVLALARVEPDRGALSWVGVGNVQGVLVRASGGREWLTSRGGVVGDRLPRLRPSEVPFGPTDLLLFATDGVAAGFAASALPLDDAAPAADTALAGFARRGEDALVWAGRLTAGAP